ncbi:DsrE/DsrF/DrsH-like family protein [Thermoactinomyces mirandus]|uniref:DsrE/DsrF/DrsH-like family protein n=1 Tax=Thermoactinomyces mirandus TaxID=2756294 RepID=A0A7W1XRR1_9BACL|nr:DsrE/DsrF/DrsH-like family protein [Thermoactinomyces mirandus]MBA4601920.1 DsrE/DsrF/DrsH-like family protein [Thermoactinomyces mirandus]
MNRKVTIIASNGNLFDAYKVFNIAAAAGASDDEVAIFFTFDGLNLIHKDLHQHLPVPAGKKHDLERFKKANVPSIPEMLQMIQEMNVKLIACQMSMNVMNVKKEDLVDGVDVGGAATFLDFAENADVSLTF